MAVLLNCRNTLGFQGWVCRGGYGAWWCLGTIYCFVKPSEQVLLKTLLLQKICRKYLKFSTPNNFHISITSVSIGTFYSSIIKSFWLLLFVLSSEIQAFFIILFSINVPGRSTRNDSYKERPDIVSCTKLTSSL